MYATAKKCCKKTFNPALHVVLRPSISEELLLKEYVAMLGEELEVFGPQVEQKLTQR